MRQHVWTSQLTLYITGIAHGSDNVLAGVFAYGEMVFDETHEVSSLRRYAHNMLTAASRRRELVEQILPYSRSQRNKC